MSFGPLASANIATLGLNPSRQEFLDKESRELTGPDRRFETRASLGLGPSEAISTGDVQRIVDACDRYFSRRPYRRWFDQLEAILQAAGASYYGGTACHLDLVQWATDPTWAKLSHQVQQRLLREDVPFLRQQLKTPCLRCLLLNGRGVLTHFMQALHVYLRPMPGIDGTAIYIGQYESIMVLAWSTNIQSSFGVSNELRRGIAERVGVLARSSVR